MIILDHTFLSTITEWRLEPVFLFLNYKWRLRNMPSKNNLQLYLSLLLHQVNNRSKIMSSYFFKWWSECVLVFLLKLLDERSRLERRGVCVKEGLYRVLFQFRSNERIFICGKGQFFSIRKINIVPQFLYEHILNSIIF